MKQKEHSPGYTETDPECGTHLEAKKVCPGYTETDPEIGITHLEAREVCPGVAETDPTLEVEPEGGARELKDSQDEELGASFHPIEKEDSHRVHSTAGQWEQ